MLEWVTRTVGPPPLVLERILTTSNGFRVGDWLFFSAEDIIERNATYEVQVEAPGWVAIANDGAGSFLLCRDTDPAVYKADMSSVETRRLLSEDAISWIEDGCPKAPHMTAPIASETVDVVIAGATIPIAAIAELRLVFGHQTVAHKLLTTLRLGHEAVMGTMHRAKAEGLLGKLSQLSRPHVKIRPRAA
jgi:hypothetical protein